MSCLYACSVPDSRLEAFQTPCLRDARFKCLAIGTGKQRAMTPAKGHRV
jgi:hypothetical protein